MQKLFFRGQFLLALGGYLTNQYVPGHDVRAYEDDSGLIEVAQSLFSHIRYVSSDLLTTKLSFPHVDTQLFYVYRRELVLADNPLAQEYGVFEIAPFPAHKRHEEILA